MYQNFIWLCNYKIIFTYFYIYDYQPSLLLLLYHQLSSCFVVLSILLYVMCCPRFGTRLLLFSVFMQFEPRVIFLLKMPKFLRERLLAQFSIFFNDFCCNVFVWLFSRCRYKNYKKVLSIDKVRKLALFECILQITPSVFIILTSNKSKNTLLIILQVPI